MRLQSAPSSILTNHFRASHASPASQHKGGNSKPAFADMPAEAAAGAMSPPSQKSLVIQDPVYGPHSITEPALVELIQCPAVQRLKEILQHGITAVIGTDHPLTRYEHSVGAMLLVRKAGGSLESQAAALLHDVAHTALSHVADNVYGYVVHEEDKMEYLNETSVPEILDRHFGRDTRERILDEENYPLLERDAPKLCADRMDYALRDCRQFGTLDLPQASAIWKDFSTFNGAFVCSTVEQALILSRAYLTCDQIAWANPSHSCLYVLAAKAIKLALTRNLLHKSDLWRLPCDVFWSSFFNSRDAEVRQLATRVRKDIQVQSVSNDTPLGGELESCSGWVFELKSKLRTIDPDVLQVDHEGQQYTRKLSELVPEYKQERESYLAAKSGPLRYRATLPH